MAGSLRIWASPLSLHVLFCHAVSVVEEGGGKQRPTACIFCQASLVKSCGTIVCFIGAFISRERSLWFISFPFPTLYPFLLALLIDETLGTLRQSTIIIIFTAHPLYYYNVVYVFIFLSFSHLHLELWKYH